MREQSKKIDQPANQEPVQPDQQFVIQALMDENRALNENKLYLLAILKQMQSEFRDAQILWESERQSLIMSKGEAVDGADGDT